MAFEGPFIGYGILALLLIGSSYSQSIQDGPTSDGNGQGQDEPGQMTRASKPTCVKPRVAGGSFLENQDKCCSKDLKLEKGAPFGYCQPGKPGTECYDSRDCQTREVCVQQSTDCVDYRCSNNNNNDTASQKTQKQKSKPVLLHNCNCTCGP